MLLWRRIFIVVFLELNIGWGYRYDDDDTHGGMAMVREK